MIQLIYDGYKDPHHRNPLKLYDGRRIEYTNAVYHYDGSAITDIHTVRDFKYCLIWSYTFTHDDRVERYTKIYYKSSDLFQTLLGSSDTHVIVNQNVCSFVPIDFTYRISNIAYAMGKYHKGYKFADNPLAHYVSISDVSNMRSCEIDFGRLLVPPLVNNVFRPFSGHFDVIIQTVE